MSLIVIEKKNYWKCCFKNVLKKTPKCFPVVPFFCMSSTKHLLKCPYSRKPSLITKLPGCTPVTYGRLFSERGFHRRRTFLDKHMVGVVLHGWSNDPIMKREAEFHKCISSNMNTTNQKVFPKHCGIKNNLSFWLTVKSFQMLSHVLCPSCWP